MLDSLIAHAYGCARGSRATFSTHARSVKTTPLAHTPTENTPGFVKMSSSPQLFTAESGANTQDADATATSEGATPVPLVKPIEEEQKNAPSSQSSYREVTVKDELLPTIALRGTFSTKTSVQATASQSERANYLTGQGQLFKVSENSEKMYDLSGRLSKLKLEKSKKEVRLGRVEAENQISEIDTLKKQIKEKDAQIEALNAQIKALEKKNDDILLQVKNPSKAIDGKTKYSL